MSGESPADEELAARARSGDRRAFEVLVGRYKAPLYGFIRRYVGNADDAYDVLQDTLVASWSALGRYDPSRSFSPWIRTVAMNKCRDFGRRRTARRLVEGLFSRDSRGDVEQHVSGAEHRSEERLGELDRAIAGLPAKYKEPLLLATLEGLSHQETAERLRLTPKAVEMRVYRAKRLLESLIRPSV